MEPETGDDPGAYERTVVKPSSSANDVQMPANPAASGAGHVPDRVPSAVAADLLQAASAQYLKTVCRVESGPGEDAQAVSWDASQAVPDQVLQDIHRADPAAAERLSRAVTSFPRIGDEFLGF